MSTRPLTTTSYAILGVLAMRPWSAYDLTGYMRTSAVRRFWPRTESRLYAEPKNLVAHALAVASREYTGRRRRTVYAITDAGRNALAAWLGERAAPQETEDEALLKMLLADHGSTEQLLATIRNAMEDLLQGVTLVLELTQRLTTGRARFPERLHITALHARHGIATMWLRYDFLRWAEEWVCTWQGTGPEGKEAAAEAILHEARTRLEDLDRELRDSLGREQAHGQTQG